MLAVLTCFNHSQDVAVELKSLLLSVDQLMASFPHKYHKEIEMAHRVLAKDMASLIAAMKAATRYARTRAEEEYRKNMLTNSHVLVFDSKHLLDTVDSVRLKMMRDEK